MNLGLFAKNVDDDFELSVTVDRAEGGGSIQDNALELMVHRRLLVDDKYGVREPLNETSFGEGIHLTTRISGLDGAQQHFSFFPQGWLCAGNTGCSSPQTRTNLPLGVDSGCRSATCSPHC